MTRYWLLWREKHNTIWRLFSGYYSFNEAVSRMNEFRTHRVNDNYEFRITDQGRLSPSILYQEGR